MQVDVTDIDSCREAIKMAIEQLGKIDVLVNNAGLSRFTSEF